MRTESSPSSQLNLLLFLHVNANSSRAIKEICPNCDQEFPNQLLGFYSEGRGKHRRFPSMMKSAFQSRCCNNNLFSFFSFLKYTWEYKSMLPLSLMLNLWLS